MLPRKKHSSLLGPFVSYAKIWVVKTHPQHQARLNIHHSHPKLTFEWHRSGAHFILFTSTNTLAYFSKMLNYKKTVLYR